MEETAREEARMAYRRALRTLRKEIWRAKRKSWLELLDDLERDPWGRPYQIVFKKLRQASLSAAESMTMEEVNRTLDDLFPIPVAAAMYTDQENLQNEDEDVLNDDEAEISEEEVHKTLKGKKSRFTAPGPDGI